MIKLYNENCLNILKTIEDNTIDLIVTDPPYKVTQKGTRGTMGGMIVKEVNAKGKVFLHNDINIKDYINELYRVLKNNSHCYLMTNHVNLQEFLNETIKAGFYFTKCLIWDKQNKIANQYYMNQFEYILFLRKGKAKAINNNSCSDILSIPNKKTKINNVNIHDTEKPVELMKILIENSSNENDLVLDPFMGSGSTGLACKMSNRSFIGIEIDEKYFNIAKERIEQNTLFW